MTNEEKLSKQGYIKVTERLPEYGDTVSWVRTNGQIIVGDFIKSDIQEPLIDSGGHIGFLCLYDVTHWKPIKKRTPNQSH